MDPVNVRRAPDGTLYTVPVDPASQQRLNDSLRTAAHASDHITDIQGETAKIAAITLALGQVRAQIGGTAGIVFSALLSGTGVAPGRLPVFGPSIFGNFAPSPLGYLDKDLTGIPKNYYLPAGSSRLVPEVVDLLGYGTREQRAEDQARAVAQYTAGVAQRAPRVDALARQLPTPLIQELQAGVPVGSLTPVGQQINTFSLTEQRAAAGRVLAERGVAPLPPPAPPPPPPVRAPVLFPIFAAGNLPAPAPGASDAVAGLRGALFDQTVQLIEAGRALDEQQAALMASIQPELIEPTNDAAIRNQNGARGINRELVSERADP